MFYIYFKIYKMYLKIKNIKKYKFEMKDIHLLLFLSKINYKFKSIIEDILNSETNLEKEIYLGLLLLELKLNKHVS